MILIHVHACMHGRMLQLAAPCRDPNDDSDGHRVQQDAGARRGARVFTDGYAVVTRDAATEPAGRTTQIRRTQLRKETGRVGVLTFFAKEGKL